MMATTNSPGATGPSNPQKRRQIGQAQFSSASIPNTWPDERSRFATLAGLPFRSWRLIPFAVCGVILLAAFAHAESAVREAAIARAERAFYQAQARFNKNPADAESGWQFGLPCFDLSELAANT